MVEDSHRAYALDLIPPRDSALIIASGGRFDALVRARMQTTLRMTEPDAIDDTTATRALLDFTGVADVAESLKTLRRATSVERLILLVAEALHAPTFAAFACGGTLPKGHPFTRREIEPTLAENGWRMTACESLIDPHIAAVDTFPSEVRAGSIVLHIARADIGAAVRTSAYLVTARRA